MARRLSLFFVILFFFVAALTVGRTVFFLKYHAAFSSAPTGAVLIAFLKGLRFDLSTACIATAPFTLLVFAPGLFKRTFFVKTVLYLLLAWEIVLIGYDYADINYYAFTQRHLTFEIGNTFTDLDVIIKLGLRSYGMEIFFVVLFMILYAVLYHRFVRYFFRERRQKLILPHQTDAVISAAAYILIIGLSVIFIRGGLQFKPLGVKNAFQNEKVELGILSLNGIYTTFNNLYKNLKGEERFAYLDSLNVPDEKRKAFFAGLIDTEKETADPEYPLYRRYNYRPSDRLNYNVVIFVMESWSAKFSQKLGGEVSALPGFDRLAEKGLLATNCFANAQRSIEGLAAIMGSLPVWQGMILGQGGLLDQTRFEPMGAVFSRMGYETMFIHGARPGSMGFDGLVKRLGFAKHISRDDFILTDENQDPVWGIYDEFTFKRANEEFRKMKKPFLSVIFSLTSHSPYTFPDRNFKKFDRSVRFAPFLNSLKYSDWALERFFEAAEKENYFGHTLFVIVGDHTEGPSTSGSLYESYRIPLLLFAPGLIKPGEISAPVSQLDILPTVMDVLKISRPFTSWGKSLFSKGAHSMVLPRGDLFVYQKSGMMLLSDIDRPMALYSIPDAPERDLIDSRPKIARNLMGDLRAYIRFSSDLIKENRLKPPGAGN